MRRAAVVVAVAVAVAYLVMTMILDKKPGESTAAELPKDPAGRRARVRAAINSQDLKGIPARLLETVADLETDAFKSKALLATNSLFNRHKGSGKGEWTGRTYYASPSDQDLRVYASLEQSVRDIVQLLHDGLYKDALAAAMANDAPRFFTALARGDGKNGYVGPANTTKAALYVVGLNTRYAGSVA